MKVPDDLPRRRRPRRSRSRLNNRGRWILIGLFAVLVALFVSARSLAGFYVEVLWFRSVDHTEVFWGILRTKVLLALSFTAGFVAITLGSLTIADRFAPMIRSSGPEEQILERYREIVGGRQGLLRAVVAVLFGIVAGVPASAHWQEWTLFRNAVNFGVSDEQFHTDVGFYVFRLPFLTYLVNWLFAAFVVVLLLTAVAHYLNGGIRLQPGERHVTPHVKLHLSALLAILAVLKAANYWLQRFELTTSKRGYVEGATYTDVNAQLPALQLLMLISVLAAVLLFVNVRQRGWRLPVIAVGLWFVVALVAGTAYPAIVQRFQVEPSESSREAPYIARNIRATNAAMNLAGTEKVELTLGEISGQDVIDDRGSLADVRLLNPRIIASTMRIDQGMRTGYVIGGATNDIDVDRYVLDGRLQQVVLGARELDLSSVPLKTWEGQHLAYTHGFGLAFAPASKADPDGRPIYVDVSSTQNALGLTRPEIYFGDGLRSYAVVDTDRVGGEETLDPTRTRYAGTGGVQLSSGLRRAAFAIYYGEYNLFGSKLIKDTSRIIYDRDVRTRVEKVAPFLELDADPYPVVVDGKLVWVLDAYTTTNRYPNAESADTRQLPAGSGLRSTFNYARNSVKAVVDAYEGSITLYVVDPSDPVIVAWQKAFPKLFTPNDQVPAELRAHFRYPEDLFRVQTNLYGRYQLEDPSDFYSQQLAWSVAQAPPTQQNASATVPARTTTETTAARTNTGRTSDADTNRFEPYYTLWRGQDEASSKFVLVRPFVPFSPNDQRRELVAFMTVSSEPEDYGKLTAFVVQPRPDGPLTVATKINQDFSQELTLLDSKGTRVEFGDMQIVSLGKGLVYVRPWFLVPENESSSQVSTFDSLTVTYEGRSVRGASLGAAIEQLWPDVDIDFGDRPRGVANATGPTAGSTGGSGSGGSAGGGESPTTPEGPQSVESLLALAQQAYDEAQVALGNFDSKTYKAKMDEAYEYARRAAEMATGDTITVVPSSSTTVPPSSSPAPPTSAPTGGSSTTVASSSGGSPETTDGTAQPATTGS